MEDLVNEIRERVSMLEGKIVLLVWFLGILLALGGLSNWQLFNISCKVGEVRNGNTANAIKIEMMGNIVEQHAGILKKMEN